MIEKGKFIETFPLTLIITFFSAIIYQVLNFDIFPYINLYYIYPFLFTTLVFVIKKNKHNDISIEQLEKNRIIEKSKERTTLHAPEIKNSNEIKLLTYNLYLRPPFVNSNGNDYKNERLNEFLNYIDNYDVLALQEVFALGNSRQNRLIKYAQKRGFFYSNSFPPPLFSRKFIDAGLVILSKYPIIETKAHIYKSGNQIDFYAAKQVLYCKLRIDEGNYLNIFTTHMQASYLDNTPEQKLQNDKARHGQIVELAQFVNEILSQQNYCYPAVILGDLNVNARDEKEPNHESEEYIYLMRQLRVHIKNCHTIDLLKESYNGKHPVTYGDTEKVDNKVVPKETVLTTKEDHGCMQCIDYMMMIKPKKKCLINEISKATKVEEFAIPLGKYRFSQLSDHYGISTKLHIER